MEKKFGMKPVRRYSALFTEQVNKLGKNVCVLCVVRCTGNVNFSNESTKISTVAHRQIGYDFGILFVVYVRILCTHIGPFHPEFEPILGTENLVN